MSAEYEAAQEICSAMHAIDQNLDRIYDHMPSQRERIATAAMQAIINARVARNDVLDWDGIAEESTNAAEALIVALNKPQKDQKEKAMAVPLPLTAPPSP